MCLSHVSLGVKVTLDGAMLYWQEKELMRQTISATSEVLLQILLEMRKNIKIIIGKANSVFERLDNVWKTNN